MSYDLRLEPWIPWRRRSGAVTWGPLAMVVDAYEGDPVVAIATPRPDFDGALQEFLIGVLSAALQPKDDRAWRSLWHAPPAPETLQAAIDALPPAFDLDGEGPRFFQDATAADFSDTEPAAIGQLLIETPGDQTIRLNKVLFIKRQRVERLGRPAAAMALLALQTYAPAGGQGHRTSLRGGGPLTTLVEPRTNGISGDGSGNRPLWHKLWANVETRAQWADRAPRGAPETMAWAFPWLRPTRTSGKGSGSTTTPADTHPLEAYFGLPRRIRLEFGGPGRCDLTGKTDEVAAIAFRMRNYGAQYEAWRHPLSPYYRPKPEASWLPVHGQPGGVGWRDWMALALRSPIGALREPAATIAEFHRRAVGLGLTTFRLHAFGYDMDNMKARGWTEAELPSFVVDDLQRVALLYQCAAALTDATGMAGTALVAAVKAALFQSPDEAAGDFSLIRNDLWEATEQGFYGTMADLASPDLDLEAAVRTAADRKQAFAHGIADAALQAFDRRTPVAGALPAVIRRRVTARHNLVMVLRGYSKLGEKLFMALGVPLPGGGQAARKNTRKRKAAE